MSTVIGDLFVRLGVDATALHKDLTKAEARFERFGTQLFFLGSRVTAGVSLPMTAALAVVGKFGLGFDQAMTESLAIMDTVSPQIRAQMESVAKSIVDFSKFSAEEGAQGFYHLASAGLDADTMMGALPITTRFAQAGMMDLAKSTEFLAGAQAAMATGLESSAEKVSQMARIADVLTLANNRALGTIQDFAEALTNKAGAALRQTNKDVEEGVAVLAAYASQNIKGKTAGQQLWMVIRDLGTYALKNADAFKKHHIAVFDATGAMKNMADIIQDVEHATAKMSDAQRAAMFIELGIPLRSVAATKALIGYSEQIREHEKALRSAGGTTQEVADKQMQSLTNQLIQMKNQFANVAIDIFQSFVPVFKDYVIPLMKSGLDVFKSFGHWVSELPAPIKAVGLAGAAALIAIGPFVAAVGSFTLLASAAIRGLSLLAGAFGVTATSAGLAAGGSKLLTMSSAELAAQQLILYRSGVAAANAQGIFGAAAIDAGFAAQAEADAIIALNAAQGKNVGMVGAAGRAWSLLFNPITLTVGAVLGGVTAFRYLNDAVDENGKKMSLWETTTDTVGKTFGIVGDILYVVTEGLKDYTKMWTGDYVQGGTVAINKTKEFAKEHSTLLNVISYLNPFITAGNVVDQYGVKVDRAKEKTESLYDAWQHFVLSVEMRKFNPEAEAARMAAAALAKGPPKMFQGAPVAPKKTEFWMGASNPFEVYARLHKEDQGGGLPDLKPEHAPKLSDAEKMFQDLAGKELQDNIKATTEAFNKLIATQQHLDPAVHERMWQAYLKLRGETDALVPAFEHLFQQEIDQYNLTKQLQFATTNWADVTSDAADKIIDDIDNVHVALFKMDAGGRDSFWAQHGDAVKSLIPIYGSLPPKVQLLVDAYQKWKIAAGPSDEFKKGAQAAITAMDDMVRNTTAKLADVETDIQHFSETAGEKHRRTIRSKLAEIAADQDKHYQEALRKLAVVDDKERDEYIRHLEQLKTLNANYLKAVERDETLRYMATIGVNASIIRDHNKFTQAQLNNIIRLREEWNRYIKSLHQTIGVINDLGGMFSALGERTDAFGQSLTSVGSSMDTISKGFETMMNAESWQDYASGAITAITGVVKAYKQMQDTGSRAGRAAQGAAIGGLIGGLPGALIGGAIGFFMGDPNWKQLQDTVTRQWNVHVSKELAKQIEKDADMIGGHVNAMLLHLSDIANEAGGFSAENVDMWARRLADTFNILARGEVSSANAAKILDASFGDLVKSGTASNGIVSDGIREMVRLERAYKTGSAAIKEFTEAQLTAISTGFGKLVGGTFGFMMSLVQSAEEADTALEKRNGLNQRAAKLQAQIADYEKEGVKNEKQRIALAIARVELLRVQGEIQKEQNKQAAADAMIQSLAGPKGQEVFARMGRLGSVAFDAMIASGKSVLETLETLGPALDTLIAAQEAFGFTSDEAFTKLMRLREFATVHPELVEQLDGINLLMQGLTNTSFLTAQTFNDLGNSAADVFNGMIEGGLSAEDAFMLMQPTLQTLWELQRKFGFATDETTQAILDQAAASGIVGEQYMSANDRMVLGIDKLIKRFELFLKYLGIDVPAEAEAAASAVGDAFDGLHPEVTVTYRGQWEPGTEPDPYSRHTLPEPPEPIPQATGGIFMRPVIAGEAGPEAFVPLDRMFDEIERIVGDQSAPVVVHEEYHITIQATDGASVERLVMSPEFGSAFRRAVRTNGTDVGTAIREA